MAGAARRIQDEEIGSDVVRRLIARPFRLVTPVPVAEPERTVAAEPAPSEENEADSTIASDVARLRTEVLLMKAVLEAERRETANLRLCLGLDAPTEELGEEARAVRERWVRLVERLISTAL